MDSPVFPTLIFYDSDGKVTLMINLVPGFEIDRDDSLLKMFPIKIKNNGSEYKYYFLSAESRYAALKLLSDFGAGTRVIKINP